MLFWSYGLMAFGMLASSIHCTSNKLQSVETFSLALTAADRASRFCTTHNGIFVDPLDCRRVITCANGAVTNIKICDSGQIGTVTSGPPAAANCVASTFPNCKTRAFYCTDKTLFDKNFFRAIHFELGNNEEENESQFDLMEKPEKEMEVLNFAQATLVQATGFNCPANAPDGVFPIAGTPTQCQTYHVCIAGKPFTATCPGSFNFDIITQKCLPAAKARCAATILPAACAQDGIQTITGFCDRFLVCCGTEVRIQYCKLGTRFDTVTLRCTLPSKSTCT